MKKFCDKCQKETKHLFGKCVEGEHFKQEMRQHLDEYLKEIEVRHEDERKSWPAINPCAFCGSDEIHVGDSGEQGGGFYNSVAVFCRRCDARGPTHDKEKIEAIKLWNARKI